MRGDPQERVSFRSFSFLSLSLSLSLSFFSFFSVGLGPSTPAAEVIKQEIPRDATPSKICIFCFCNFRRATPICGNHGCPSSHAEFFTISRRRWHESSFETRQQIPPSLGVGFVVIKKKFIPLGNAVRSRGIARSHDAIRRASKKKFHSCEKICRYFEISSFIRISWRWNDQSTFVFLASEALLFELLF